MAPWWAWSHASPSSGWSGRAPRLAILPAIEPIPSRCCHIGSAVADEKAEVRRQTNSRQQLLALSFRAEREISQRDPSGLACVRDRKSTRLNSSHGYISYAVFCLKKKKKNSRYKK